VPLGAFRGEMWVAPNHFLTPPKFGKGIKWNLLCILLLFRKTGPFETWRNHPHSVASQQYAISAHSHVFFFVAMDLIITSVTKQDLVVNEESLIDRDSDVFDTEITISPISVSKRNMSDNVGRCIPFLEVV
jgi:hypothetical protein